jgi:hypothetical protein
VKLRVVTAGVGAAWEAALVHATMQETHRWLPGTAKAYRDRQDDPTQRPRTTPATTEAKASALLTTKLLQDIVEVAAEDGDIGVVGLGPRVA